MNTQTRENNFSFMHVNYFLMAHVAQLKIGSLIYFGPILTPNPNLMKVFSMLESE